MLNYEEELKKFKPCLSVEDVEESVYEKDLTDVIDIIRETLRSKAVNKGADE